MAPGSLSPHSQRVLLDPPSTLAMKHRPLTMPGWSHREETFAPHTAVVLQFLPSGTCMVLALDKPVTLGRGQSSKDLMLDLNELNAHQHGVSRRHCVLQRHGSSVVVTDLHSTNGTYLNDTLLTPLEATLIRHGDRLTLGTLPVVIEFETALLGDR